MTQSTIGSRRKLYCNTCKGETHHELLFVHKKHYNEVANEPYPQVVFEEEFRYCLWVCCGCDTATLEETYNNTGMINDEGEEVWESKLYPRRERTDWPIKRFRRLNTKLSSIYREVIESFNGDSRILCATGLRALLEGICADKQTGGKDLVHKINGLKEHLPSNIVDSLHGFRFMGNEAAHELQAPERSELQLAIEVIEDLLNFLYELEYKAGRLPKKV